MRPVPVHHQHVQAGSFGIRRRDLPELLRLTGAAVKVYLALAARTHWGRGGGDFGLAVLNTDARAEIAEQCDVDARTLRRALAELTGAGLVKPREDRAAGARASVLELPRFAGAGRESLPGWIGPLLALLSAAPQADTDVRLGEPEAEPQNAGGHPGGHRCPLGADTDVRLGSVSADDPTACGGHSYSEEEDRKKTLSETRARDVATTEPLDDRAFDLSESEQPESEPCRRAHAPGSHCDPLVDVLTSSPLTEHLDRELGRRIVHQGLVRSVAGRECVLTWVREFCRGGKFDPQRAGREKPSEGDVLRYLAGRFAATVCARIADNTDHGLPFTASDVRSWKGADGKTKRGPATKQLAQFLASNVTGPLHALARGYRSGTLAPMPPQPEQPDEVPADPERVKAEIARAFAGKLTVPAHAHVAPRLTARDLQAEREHELLAELEALEALAERWPDYGRRVEYRAKLARLRRELSGLQEHRTHAAAGAA